MTLGITDLKKGMIFQLDGVLYRVLDYSQKVMGRGGSIVNVRIKNLSDGRVLEKTFKGNERLENADMTNRNVQYLYNDGNSYFFMDADSYEQFEIPSEDLEDRAGYLKEGGSAVAQLFNSRVVNINLPKNVPLAVTYTEDVVKGDTASAITKNATLETGLVIKVPAFIKKGDLVSVNTEDGSYRERIKNQ